MSEKKIHDLNHITGFGILEFDDWNFFEFQHFLCSREAKYKITSKN